MAQLEKAYFTKYGESDKIAVMFNPAEVSIKKTVPWNPQPKSKKDTPKQQFTAGQARTMSLKLEFDTSGMGGDDDNAIDVRAYVEPITALANIPEDDGGKKYPPLLNFEWGQGVKFTCVIKSVNVTYTRFNLDGSPIRANMQVELYEAKPGDYNKFLSDNSSGGSVKVADEKSTAQNMSGEDWQDDASNNNVDQPRNLEPGQPYQTG